MTTKTAIHAVDEVTALRALQDLYSSDDGQEEEEAPRRPRTSAIKRPPRVTHPVDRSALHGPYADIPRSRDQARTEGAPFYFMGLPCFRGHNGLRKTHSRLCVHCSEQDRKKAAQERNRARVKAARIAREEAEKEARRERRREEREARKKARDQERAEAARAAAKAADTAQAEAPMLSPLPDTAPTSDLSAPPWDTEAAPPLPHLSPDSSAPWDAPDDLNPFD